MSSAVPKLVAVSGRTEDAVDQLLDKVKENETDDEFVAMVQELHNFNIVGHNFRGYQILGDNDNPREVIELGSEKRPIW